MHFSGHDLAGKRFEKLVVQAFAGKTPRGAALWLCLCDCGASKTVVGSSLTGGLTRSCGCLRATFHGDDLVGQRFGRLVVERRISAPGKPARWACRCECGRVHEAAGNNLRSGQVLSCGCSHGSEHLVTHGEGRSGQRTPEYRTWLYIKARCHNPKNTRWDYYGGRGIAVCQQWRDSFHAFVADMGRKPSPLHEIDRINNDGNYEPGNCRWVTKRQNALNRRPKSRR